MKKIISCFFTLILGSYIFLNANEVKVHIETPGTLIEKLIEAGVTPEDVRKLTISGTLNDFDFYTCSMNYITELDISEITNTSIPVISCWYFEKVILPKNLTEICDKCFNGSSNLTNITIFDKVTSIGKNAFGGCTALESISLPNSINNIEEYAFSFCHSLKKIVIPTNVTVINNSVFSTCSRLESVILSNMTTTIGEYAFSGCESLTSIEIPSTVNKIGVSAFSGSSVKSVYISNFENWCNINFDLFSNPLNNGADLFINGIKATDISFPDGIETIPERILSGCTSVESITIPESVKTINSLSFENCTNLTTITILSLTPPNVPNSYLSVPYENYSPKPTIKVYAEAKTLYKTPGLAWWLFNCQSIEGFRTITAIANDNSFGIVEGGGYFDSGDIITLTATPNDGYKFIGWSDESFENPRTLIVSEDIELTAYFTEEKTTTIDNINESNINLYVNNKTIFFKEIKTNYKIFNSSGKLIYIGNKPAITLPQGLYIITIEDNIEKVIL